MELEQETRKKLSATTCILLMLMASFGLMALSGAHNGFVQASETVYEVSQITWINATTISPSNKDLLGSPQYKEIKIVISKSMSADGNVHQSDTGSGGFTPDTQLQSYTWMEMMDRQSPGILGQKMIGAATLDFTNTEFGILESYVNGTQRAVNSSDFFTNFEQITSGGPAIEKILSFDSPYNYANEYCYVNGYTFNNIINSTYEEVWAPDTLNTMRSRLLKTDIMITEVTPHERGSWVEASGDVKPCCDPITAAILIGIAIAVVICIVTPYCASAAVECTRLTQAGLTARDQIQADKEVALAAIDAEKEVQLALIAAQAENQRLILEMVNNGTISVEDAIMLSDGLNYPYQQQLNNRTDNIEEILDDYFSHVENQWDKYGTIFASSWSDSLVLILVLCIVVGCMILAIVIIYKKKGQAMGQGQPIQIFALP